MGEMAAGVEGFDGLLEQIHGLLFQARLEDAVVGPPHHMQGLLGQGQPAAAKPSAAGKGGEGVGPARALQMQRSNLFFCSSHAGVRIGKGLSAQTLANPRPRQKPDTEAIQQRRHRHGTTGQTRRSQEQKRADAIA